MYFSVITPVDGHVREAVYELARSGSRYAEHQLLWQFFPDAPDAARDFIFRRQANESPPRFYMVSHRLPVAPSDAWQVRSRDYDPQLRVGEQLAFQLQANPVVAKKNEEGKSRRHDVVMAAKKVLLAGRGLPAGSPWKDWKRDGAKPLTYDLVQTSCVDWLSARAEKNGYALLQSSVDAYQQHRARSGERDIRFSSVDFSGELTVTDPALFRRMLFRGLGHAKAFGCGLMLVKRVSEV